MMRGSSGWLALVTLLLVILILAGGCSDPADRASQDSDAGGVELVETIDGDTFDVRIDGVTERVRLVGINTPERGECLASEATDALDQLLRSGPIRLDVDTNDRDRWDRLLRHVWVDDTYLNEQLVIQGLAIARSYPPDTMLDDRLSEAQSQAESAGVGRWSPDACGPPATDSAAGPVNLRIDEVEPDAPGNDAENLNGEWVRIVNDGAIEIELLGWMLQDESSSHRYEFPAATIDPQGTITIRSGCGEDSDTELHWCVSGSAVWNNDGDTVFLLDPSGNLADSLGY